MLKLFIFEFVLSFSRFIRCSSPKALDGIEVHENWIGKDKNKQIKLIVYWMEQAPAPGLDINFTHLWKLVPKGSATGHPTVIGGGGGERGGYVF